MKLPRAFLIALASIVMAVIRLPADSFQPTNRVATAPVVYVPDMMHTGEPLPAGILMWDHLMQAVDSHGRPSQLTFHF